MRRVLSVTVLFLFFFVFVSFVSLQQGGTALCRLLRVKIINQSINQECMSVVNLL